MILTVCMWIRSVLCWMASAPETHQHPGLQLPAGPSELGGPPKKLRHREPALLMQNAPPLPPAGGGQAGNVQQEAVPWEVDAITKRLDLACTTPASFPVSQPSRLKFVIGPSSE